MCVCLYQESVCKELQSRRVHLFIVNSLLKCINNILHVYYLFLSQHYKPNFHAKNII